MTGNLPGTDSLLYVVLPKWPMMSLAPGQRFNYDAFSGYSPIKTAVVESGGSVLITCEDGELIRLHGCTVIELPAAAQQKGQEPICEGDAAQSGQPGQVPDSPERHDDA